MDPWEQGLGPSPSASLTLTVRVAVPAEAARARLCWELQVGSQLGCHVTSRSTDGKLGPRGAGLAKAVSPSQRRGHLT